MPGYSSPVITPQGTDITGAFPFNVPADFSGNPSFNRWIVPPGYYGAMITLSLTVFTSAVVATRYFRLVAAAGINVSGQTLWEVRCSQSTGASEQFLIFASPEVQTFNQGPAGPFQTLQIPYFLIPQRGGVQGLWFNNQAGDGTGGQNAYFDLYPWGQETVVAKTAAPVATPLLL